LAPYLLRLNHFSSGARKKTVACRSNGYGRRLGLGIKPDNLSTGTAWIVTLAYTLQLYFDFSGYCDMAMGSALLFNIRLPLNFNSPYHALSIQDFWKRWHITLSAWLRDYIYIPLGGNRKGLARTIVNVFTTFLIGGIWHGAGWTFVIWGAMHGFALAINNLWKNLVAIRLNKVYGWIITFSFVHFAWIFFRAPDVTSAFDMIHRMFCAPQSKGVQSFQWGFAYNALFYLTLCFIIIILPLSNTFIMGTFLTQKSRSSKLQTLTGVYCALILFLCFLRLLAKNIPRSPFLYFQF
jgi:D-alanyl-lipoteichoic acid acyltransferase DltB (MBOAT superfamily)